MTHILPDRELLKVSEVAAVLGFTPRSLYRWIEKEALPVVYVRTRIRIRRTEALALIRDRDDALARLRDDRGAA